MRPTPPLAAALAGAAVLLAAAGCPTAPLEVLDAEVLGHPTSTVSCEVRWSTPQPARARVEFGEADTALQWAIDGSHEPSTEHELVVYGLYPDASFTLVPVAIDADGSEVRGPPLPYDTGALPFPSAVFEITEYDPDRALPGWTLTNLVMHSLLSPVVAIALDPEGRVRWYHQLGTEPAFADVEVSWVGDAVLIGGDLAPGDRPVEVTLANEVRWQGPPQPDDYLLPGAAHHTYQRLAGGDYLTLVFDEVGGVLAEAIEQRGADRTLRWRWDAADHVPGATDEHIHGNMALVDEDSDRAWFNSLLLARFYQLDRATGALDWALGDGGDFTFVGDHDHPWVWHAHGVEWTADGTVLMYDNGQLPSWMESRVVEYALDEHAMTAELVWEYPGALADDPWFTSYWGDADRLANGNTLVTAGTVFEFDTPSQLFEVTADGERVWGVSMTSEVAGMPAGCYAAERFPVPLDEL